MSTIMRPQPDSVGRKPGQECACAPRLLGGRVDGDKPGQRRVMVGAKMQYNRLSSLPRR